MDSQKFCLKWDSFQSSVTSLFDSLRRDGELVDVTLCCEGQRVQAHRMMLSACSPYFRELLKANQCQQMAIFLKDTSAADLNAIIEFMYKGSVNVSQSQLPSFIKTAEMLQIRGLSGDEEKGAPPPSPRRAPPPPPPPVAAPTPPHKRRRLSGGSASGGRRSPVSPGRRPRTPTPPPFAPPPQLHPPPVLPSVTPHMGATPEQLAPPPMPAAAAAPLSHSVKAESNKSMKVEKIDLTEDDDDASLDSALYNVGEYEGAGGHAAEYDGSGDHAAEYDGSYDGSNSGMDHMSFMPAGGDMDGVAPLGAGPSQGPPRTLRSQDMSPLTPGSQSGEDGSASGAHPNKCHICSKEYKHRDSLLCHMKVHEGLTTCPRCGKVCCTVQDLRKHMRMAHKMTQAQVWDAVPTLSKFFQVPVFHLPRTQ